MSEQTKIIEDFANREYEHGFVTDVEADTFPPGLNEDVVRAISAKKNEPEWMTEWSAVIGSSQNKKRGFYP
jgi:Fe-S cluster assembly protein SufB